MDANDRIIRMPQVMEMVGLQKSAIYKLIKSGEFPLQIKLGAHASGWLEADIAAWVRNRSETIRDRGNEALARVIRMPMDGEVLHPDELTVITGRKDAPEQAKWLTARNWAFLSNDQGRVIVGRLYARLRLCGIDLPGMAAKCNRVPATRCSVLRKRLSRHITV